MRLLVKKGNAQVLASIPIADEILNALTEYGLEHNLIRNANDLFDLLKEVNRGMLSATEIAPLKQYKLVKDDPHDDKYLAVAIEGNADYLVSNDHHILDLKRPVLRADRKELQICSTREMATIMAQRLLVTPRPARRSK